ncbi:MAG: COX15/CtaA family protein, partial [Hyphomicrobiaceae bacterium]
MLRRNPEMTVTLSHSIALRASAQSARDAPTDPLLRAWLFVLAALIVVMVVVGGATRLTDSGLSITEWQPLLGA